MFRITWDLSSGSFTQPLAKITEMILSHPLIWKSWQRIVCVLHSVERHCVCTAQCREAMCMYCTV